MVFPRDRSVSLDNADPIKIPRARFYVETNSNIEYVVFVQSKTKNALCVAKISEYMLGKYSDLNIYFISKRKLKISSKNMSVANEIALDIFLNFNFATFIPSEYCEVKGVVPVDTSFSEEDIYKAVPENLAQFGEVPPFCKVAEVKRFSKHNPDNPNVRTLLDSVVVCFSGNYLPSHIKIGGVNYPVNPFRAPILQYKKCYRFNHTERVCSRQHKVCVKCGDCHQNNEECNSPLKCVNCNAAHSADSKLCPVYKKIFNNNIVKANSLKPKVVSFAKPTYANPNPHVFEFQETQFPSLMSVRRRPAVASSDPAPASEPNKKNSSRSTTAKRARSEAGSVSSDIVSELQTASNKLATTQICNDIHSEIKSQIVKSDNQTIQLIKPFFESLFNNYNSNIQNKATEDTVKPLFSSILKIFNELNENNSIELH